MHPSKPSRPSYYVFPVNVIDMMKRYGEFDFGVIGWCSRGKLQVVPGYEDVCIYTAPLTFHEYTWGPSQTSVLGSVCHEEPNKSMIGPT
jgi:hypothetical protein